MAKITYEDKVSTRVNSIPLKNQITAGDMIEIKNSVNSLYDSLSSPLKTVVVIPNSQVLTMGDIEVQILPELPIDQYYLIYWAIVKNKKGTSDFLPEKLQFYGCIMRTIPEQFLGAPTPCTYTTVQFGDLTALDPIYNQKGLWINTQSGTNPSGGDGDLEVVILYSIEDF